MRILTVCISLFLIYPAIAEAPECPSQPNRSECLRLAQENYIDRLKFLEEDNSYLYWR
jgi:hypothetical protein